MTSDAVPQEPQVFKYEAPVGVMSGKKSRRLAKTDISQVHAQLITSDGGETNLHSHTGEDETWLVLNGRVRWYGAGDVVIADQGKYEGIIIPRGFPYWFESSGDEPLEIMRFGARDQTMAQERVDYNPPKVAANAEGGLGGRAPTPEELAKLGV